MIRVIFRNEAGQAIKTLQSWEIGERGLPAIGDIVAFYWGDDEIGERYVIKQRIFDGFHVDRMEYIVERI